MENKEQHLEGHKLPDLFCSASSDRLDRGFKVLQSVTGGDSCHALYAVPWKDWLPINNAIAIFAVVPDTGTHKQAQAFLCKAQDKSFVPWSHQEPSRLHHLGHHLRKCYMIMRRRLCAWRKRQVTEWGYIICEGQAACAIAEFVPKSSQAQAVAGGVIVRYILLFDKYIRYQARLQGSHMKGIDLGSHYAKQLEMHRISLRKVADDRLQSFTDSGRHTLKALEAQVAQPHHKSTPRVQVAQPHHESAPRVQVAQPHHEAQPHHVSAPRVQVAQPHHDSAPRVQAARPNYELTTSLFNAGRANLGCGWQTLLAEYERLLNLQSSMPSDSSLPGGSFTVKLADRSDLYRWHITLSPVLFTRAVRDGLHAHALFKARHLTSDVGDGSIEMEIQFPNQYPFEPPFFRIVSPRFATATCHVTIGGSIYMPLLTWNGWTPVHPLESLLVDVISKINDGDSQIDVNCLDDVYLESEAFAWHSKAHWWEA